MGNRLSNILRLSATALLLVAGVYGYICYEKTRIVWWLPVAAAVGGAVVTMPLLSLQRLKILSHSRIIRIL